MNFTKLNVLNSDKIFGHIFDLAENAITGLFYGDKTFKAKSPVNKKTYQPEKLHFSEASEYDIETKLSRLRWIGRNLPSDCDVFMAQAKYLKDLTDCYDSKHKTNCSMNFPLYHQLQMRVLRTYLTWRTKVFNGEYLPADSLFLRLYMTEIVIGIHNFKNDDVVGEFFHLIDAQKDKTGDAAILPCHYLLDYVILNDTSYTVEQIWQRLPNEYKQHLCDYSLISRENYCSAPLALAKQSSYNFLSSKIMDSEFGAHLLPCIDFVFHIISDFMNKSNIDFYNLLFGETIQHKVSQWYPYNYNPYIKVPFSCEVDVTLPNGEHFQKHNGHAVVTHNVMVGKNIFREAIGYTIKYIESRLRDKIGFKPKLTVNPSKVLIESPMLTYQQLRIFRKAAPLFVSNEMANVIDNAVTDFCRQSHLIQNIPTRKGNPNQNENSDEQPIEVTIDPSKFEHIRSGAEYLTSVLVVEEEEKEDISAAVNDIEAIDKSDNIFDNLHTQAIEIILNGSDILTKLNTLASQNVTTVEMLLDEINEAALDTIGDNIIDTADEPYIYEDYIDEVKKLMEEK